MVSYCYCNLPATSNSIWCHANSLQWKIGIVGRHYKPAIHALPMSWTSSDYCVRWVWLHFSTRIRLQICLCCQRIYMDLLFYIASTCTTRVTRIQNAVTVALGAFTSSPLEAVVKLTTRIWNEKEQAEVIPLEVEPQYSDGISTMRGFKGEYPASTLLMDFKRWLKFTPVRQRDATRLVCLQSVKVHTGYNILCVHICKSSIDRASRSSSESSAKLSCVRRINETR